jgi:hypothetical protein
MLQKLHYKADTSGLSLSDDKKEKLKLINRDYRQNWGAKAAYELVEFLDKDSFNEYSTQYVKAYASSRVNTPNDLFDMY